ncbi:MAG: hypothetical protein ACREMY_27990, partial [bacterium]
MMTGLPAGALAPAPRLQIADRQRAGAGRWQPFVVASALAGVASTAFVWITWTQVGGESFTTP